MKWTLLDTYGLQDVLVALSEGREVYAQEGHMLEPAGTELLEEPAQRAPAPASCC